MRYEVGRVLRVGKYSGKQRSLYFVRDRVTQRLIEIDERYGNFYTSRKRLALERAEIKEAENRQVT